MNLFIIRNDAKNILVYENKFKIETLMLISRCFKNMESYFCTIFNETVQYNSLQGIIMRTYLELMQN